MPTPFGELSTEGGLSWSTPIDSADGDSGNGSCKICAPAAVSVVAAEDRHEYADPNCLGWLSGSPDLSDSPDRRVRKSGPDHCERLWFPVWPTATERRATVVHLRAV